jgi:hypothetical protein
MWTVPRGRIQLSTVDSTLGCEPTAVRLTRREGSSQGDLPHSST